MSDGKLKQMMEVRRAERKASTALSEAKRKRMEAQMHKIGEGNLLFGEKKAKIKEEVTVKDEPERKVVIKRRTPAMRREIAIRKALSKIGFFESLIEPESSDEDELQAAYEATPSLHKQKQIFEGAVSDSNNAAGGAKSKREIDMEFIRMQQELVEMEEKNLDRTEVNESEWREANDRDACIAAEENAQRISSIKCLRDKLIQKQKTPSKTPADSDSSSDDSSDEMFGFDSWKMKAK
eukprot:TRINITY_DN2242_c5_g1_i1.p1 TRINITY_DN2242_c5_g1~~TRINITY_DN2242_c5_g1_i1.p1  ORF type:complete len:258 (+),score=78.71 TRINITY_DN2242_c5_g1_i1:64-774(+)